MPKINQEEYEILKTMLSVGYEYIAREKEGHVIVFTAYHGKSEHRWMVTTNRVGLKCESLFNSNEVFQFIQWSNSEPYNIAELIEEYESEETEVKNIEWLKETLEERIDTMAKFEDVSYSIGLKEAYQHTLLLINQLDDPETLSQEWIDNHTDKFVGNEGHRFVSTKDLQNLLVPKQEEVDRAYKDGYEKGKEHATEKQSEETETVARVLVDYLIASAKLKLALSMEVEELEE